MSKYWCVNFMDDDCLTHGISERLWLMGYQCGARHAAQWNAACTANWRILQRIGVGDELVAYVPRNGLKHKPRGPGFAFLATGRVRMPRRPPAAEDARDAIEEYISRAKAHKRGYVYFDSSVVYENFTDGYSNLPARIDVEAWENYVPRAILLGLDVPRNETVRAAFQIDKSTFNRILSRLTKGTK